MTESAMTLRDCQLNQCCLLQGQHWFKKTETQIYFWDNFGNSAPILTILSLLQTVIHGT